MDVANVKLRWLISAIVWICVLFICVFMYKHWWTPIKEYKNQQRAIEENQATIEKTSAPFRYQNVARIGADKFAGYGPFRSSTFTEQCNSYSLSVDFQDDYEDCSQKIKDIKDAKLDLAVISIDKLVKCSADLKDFPATIVAVLSESKGEFYVLVVRRDYLLKNKEIVEQVVKAYLTTIYKEHPVVESVVFKNTQNNFGYFGFIKKTDLPHIEQICRNSINGLIKSDVIKTDPTNNKPNILYFNDIMYSLFKLTWHPAHGTELPTLPDSEWANLKPMELLIPIPNLIFIRGTDSLSPANQVILTNLISQLKITPQCYLLVKSSVSTSGDEEANLKLSNNRAESVVKWLISHGVNSNRIRSESNKASGSATVSFVLYEQPY